MLAQGRWPQLSSLFVGGNDNSAVHDLGNADWKSLRVLDLSRPQDSQGRVSGRGVESRSTLNKNKISLGKRQTAIVKAKLMYNYQYWATCRKRKQTLYRAKSS